MSKPYLVIDDDGKEANSFMTEDAAVTFAEHAMRELDSFKNDKSLRIVKMVKVIRRVSVLTWGDT